MSSIQDEEQKVGTETVQEQVSQTIPAAPSPIESQANSGQLSEAVAGRVQDFDASFTSIGNGNITTQAQRILNADPEATVWQESPSLALLIAPALKWMVILLITFLAFVMNASSLEKEVGPRPTAEEKSFLTDTAKQEETLTPTKKKKKSLTAAKEKKLQAQKRNEIESRVQAWERQSLYFLGWIALLLYCILSLLHKTLKFKGTSYTMSSQRLVIETGILSKTSWPIELHHLGNGLIHKPLTLRIFNVGNLQVSGLTLMGLRNPELVRDLIRGAGQLEAQRFDKARWR